MPGNDGILISGDSHKYIMKKKGPEYISCWMFKLTLLGPSVPAESAARLWRIMWALYTDVASIQLNIINIVNGKNTDNIDAIDLKIAW